MLESLNETKELKNNTEEKNFRYKVFDCYEEVTNTLIKKEFESQTEVEDYSLYFMLYENKFIEAIKALNDCSKRFVSRASATAFFEMLAKRLKAKIAAKGAPINI